MKIFKIIIIFLFLLNGSIFGQGIEHNLEKYWYYRQRLEERFMVVSAGNEQGTNKPMAGIGYVRNNITFLYWGDGNGESQYYLGVLATEYKLLKEYGQDYTNTLNNLAYALRAIDRIDKNAEKYWRGGDALSSDLNGFFMRDDVDRGFAQRWATPENEWSNKKVSSTFARINADGTYSDGLPYEMSQDNVWHYLHNLALVKELVDDPTLFTDGSGEQVTIKQWAQKIAYRMVNQLHYAKKICSHWVFKLFPWPPHFECVDYMYFLFWRVINPVTEELVKEGAYSNGVQSFFAEAGNWITEKQWGDMHFANSRDLLDGSISIATQLLANNTGVITDDYHYRSLLTAMGEEYFVEYWESLGVEESLYRRLCQYREYHIQYPEFPLTYEHFPLIFLTLHGGYEEESFDQETRDLYISVLDEAPDCGPYDFGNNNQDDWSALWSASNRLVWPESCNDPGTWGDGEYHGLDYMLLHNLFWLVYLSDNNPQNKHITTDFPYDIGNDEIWGNDNNPADIYAQNKITADNIIGAEGNVSYNAYEVVLLPGFETNIGADFEAISLEFNYNDYVYEKLSYTPDCSYRKGIATDNDSLKTTDEMMIETNYKEISQLFVYPVPANDYCNILFILKEKTTGNDLILSITDISGKEYYKEIINQENASIYRDKINTSNYPSGIYFINVRGNKFSETKKLVVK